ncbi:MAG TPA: ankyrin repeat domain-containing protein [Terriglobia bacterium]|nr:ankyrin repeat domain-containing protein [Terriglobia bacterium]
MTVRRLLPVLFFAVAVLAQNPSSSQPLLIAIQHGSVSDVERLLNAGANANSVDADGIPALMSATLFGNARIVRALLDHGANVNQSGPAGATALMWAIPDPEKVRLLLAHGADVNARSETQRTALLVAASYPGSLDLVRTLIEKGADIRAQDQGGATALSFAMRSSDVAVVRYLVDRGLDPNTLSAVAQGSAVQRYDLPTAEYLMSRISKPQPQLLVGAATWQPLPLVQRWIQLGAEANATVTGTYTRTPLLSAVTSEAASAETVDALLRAGADPNGPLNDGESPLDWAIYKGDQPKVQVLEKHGAKRANGPRSQEIALPSTPSMVDARVSLTRAVAPLLEAAATFRDKTTVGCISCHHNAMPALAVATARDKRIQVDEMRARKNLEDIYTFFKSNVPRILLGDTAVGGEALTAGYSQMALAANGYPVSTVTAAITHWLLARQMPDGRWLGNGVNRPPSEYSTISHTALAAGGLKAYALPARREQIAESLRRAQRWLLQTEPKSAEERAMRLMGLVWTDAARDRISAAVKDIRDRQDVNGGWSQFGRTPPDAYATGQSLYALHLAGMRSTDQVYRKGVRFLLDTQFPDGTWLVRTHAFPVQRYFESGFPYGRHQWVSTAGTSWAVLAIAQTVTP